MPTYELIIHLRDAVEPVTVVLAGVDADHAESVRERVMYDVEQARLAEAPQMEVDTGGAVSAQPLVVNPHDVTAVDLVEERVADS